MEEKNNLQEDMPKDVSIRSANSCNCGEKSPDINEPEKCCSKEKETSKETSKKNITSVSTKLTFKDFFGACKARWGIGRMDYKIEPGLYAVGKPDDNSPVLVSANYKLTFDTLRKNLSELNCWILILDTKGINVWCAAGKGTFGTEELIKRIKDVGLSEIVKHRKLILPQLGASGVCAHEVERDTGFYVMYGPVRASDIKTFISSGYTATKKMRRVKFTFKDRLVLTPIELAEVAKKTLPVFGILFLINLFAAQVFGLLDFVIYVGAILVGAFLVPIMLPFIPGKAFSWKGWLLGFLWTLFAISLFGWFTTEFRLLASGYLLLLPSLSAYLALNFTGCSTYTSPSGVLKEMRIALPLIIVPSILGVVLILLNKLFFLEKILWH